MPTPLEPIFKKRVTDAVHVVIRDQVNPWLGIADTGPFTIRGYHGAQMAYEGKKYVGRAQQSFWNGYIEPFLENFCTSEIAAAASAAEHRGLDPNEVLAEVEDLLRVGVVRVYHEMARIDQALARLEFPQAPMKSTDGYVKYMQDFVAERIRAERALWGTATRAQIWHSRHRFWAWAATTVIAFMALLVATIALFK